MSRIHSRPLIILPVETLVREYHGKLLFSLVAVERGWDVILGAQEELVRNIDLMEKGIYIDKSVADTKVEWFRRCAGLGNEITAWDEEGLVFFSKRTYRKLRICRDAIERVSLFFAWGDVQAEAITGAFPDLEDRVVTTGNPRFDVLRPELRGFFSESAEGLRRRYGPFILVNTNFAFANHYLGEETLRGMLKNYSIAEEGDFFEGWIGRHKEGFPVFLGVLPAIRRAFPRHGIVVRPHPSENLRPWQDAAGDLDRVWVDNGGNVAQWILASEAVVHFNCTTGIEAFLLDVPSISFRAAPPSKYEHHLPNRLSIEAGDEGTLIAVLEEILTRGPGGMSLRGDPDRVRDASLHVSSMEGSLASEKVAEALASVAGPAERGRSLRHRLAHLRNNALPALLRLVERARGAQGTYGRHKFPGLSASEVRRDVSRFQSLTGRFAGTRTRKLRANCFLLTSGKP